MSSFGNDSKEKLNIDNLKQAWAKNDIQRFAENSRRKLDSLVDYDRIEENLESQSKQRQKQRDILRDKRAGKVNETYVAGEDSQSVSAVRFMYEARTALKNDSGVRYRREGIIQRTIKLLKGYSAAKKDLKKRSFVSAEQIKVLRGKVFRDAYKPVYFAFKDAEDTLWEFIRRVGIDAWDIVLFIVEFFIKVVYYAGTLALFLWDIIWDVRYWLDENKKKIFLYFSSAVCSVAIVLIVVSSVSAYEYSYCGKKLGVAKSKEDVYRSIDVLGDKLSQASGANISIDVERDMEFKKIYGFKISADSTDTILNTLTYMKDLQATACAINVDGNQKVIVESKEAADAIIAKIKSDAAKDRDGVEYSLISFGEVVTTEEVNVLLGDIWNSEDAIKYLETGSVKHLSDAEAAKPIVNVYSIETATYEKEIPFDTEYLNNSSIYADEIEVISKGIVGKDLIVATVERINGIEQSRKILSTTRISNPISAIAYKGTKPIPEKIGTGTWLFPLKAKYHRTTRFGVRYGVAGVSPVHKGVDYACPTGTKIYATDGGVVIFAGWKSGYGYCVQINHGGLYTSLYGHCSKLLVKAGDDVYQGQNIALVGSTGKSTGSHLHFEVRYKDEPIDPEKLF